MSTFASSQFGSVFSALLQTDRCRPLDAGRPELAVKPALQQMSLQSAFAHATVVDDDMARCCLAGVWLLHNFLDESHRVSQEIETPSGSFWHGIMHRREGDYSNAKYWFRRVGRHAVFAELGSQAASLAVDAGAAELAERLAPQGQFDPYAMIDLCQAAIQRGESQALLRRVQQAEWELLFAHCYSGAVGG